ncbi:MAG: TolC family protein [Bryobacterales bacterium]|nr:TolC family protein [Bryobacterales bacterium]
MCPPTCVGRMALVIATFAMNGMFAQSVSPSGSQSGPGAQPERTQLRALIDQLVENNPEIRAARYRHEAATKRPSQVGTLPEPKLTFVDFGVGHPFSTLDVSNFAYKGFGISQEVPFPGKLALASEEARREAQAEGAAYRSIVLDAISRLKIAYFEWFNAAKATEITRKNRDLLDQFEKIARARYSVGKGIQQDVLKAQVELSGLAQQLELLQERKEAAEAQINALLNRPIDTPLGAPPPTLRRSPFQMDLEALLGAIQEGSPQLRARQFQVDARAVGIDRARREFRPDFGFSFQWQKTSAQFPDYYMAMAEVKIPVYFWRKQRYALEEASARVKEARENYAATRQELIFAAKDQYLAIRTSERVLALYESGVIPQAALSVESAMAAYEVGSVDFLSLLSSLTTLLNFEIQYYTELTRHEQALARLEPVIGQPLAQP